jgi:NADH-quinone oxidoreductase subunit J
MSLPFLVFFVCAFVAVLGALLLIVAKEPIHSALALVLVMISLAVLYLMLGAEFIAAVQVIVYAGAIMVLFVFVIMLLNAGSEERTDWSKMAKYVGMPLGIFLLLELGHWMYYSAIGKEVANGSVATSSSVSTVEMSKMLFNQYVFPFEATSVLILIAILGALVLAKRDDQ